MENGTMSVIGAIEVLDEVDKDRAKEMVEEIKAEEKEVGDDGSEVNEGAVEGIIEGQPAIEIEPEGDIRG